MYHDYCICQIEFKRVKDKLASCKKEAVRLLERAKKVSGTGPKEDLSDHYVQVCNNVIIEMQPYTL